MLVAKKEGPPVAWQVQAVGHKGVPYKERLVSAVATYFASARHIRTVCWQQDSYCTVTGLRFSG
jgi:hypothetical protein